MIGNLVQTLNQGFMILLVTYVLGLLWYRLSDYLNQFIGIEEDDERTFVVFWGLRYGDCESDIGEK
jgi:hypothetical protein